ARWGVNKGAKRYRIRWSHVTVIMAMHDPRIRTGCSPGGVGVAFLDLTGMGTSEDAGVPQRHKPSGGITHDIHHRKLAGGSWHASATRPAERWKRRRAEDFAHRLHRPRG